MSFTITLLTVILCSANIAFAGAGELSERSYFAASEGFGLRNVPTLGGFMPEGTPLEETIPLMPASVAATMDESAVTANVSEDAIFVRAITMSYQRACRLVRRASYRARHLAYDEVFVVYGRYTRAIHRVFGENNYSLGISLSEDDLDTAALLCRSFPPQAPQE